MFWREEKKNIMGGKEKKKRRKKEKFKQCLTWQCKTRMTILCAIMQRRVSLGEISWPPGLYLAVRLLI